MARGAVRGAVSAWLGLIVLQTVTSKGGSGKVAGAFDAVNSLVKRALDPGVAAIPDYAHGGGSPSSPTSGSSSSTAPKLPAAAPAYTTVGGRVPVPTGTAGTTTRPN